MSVTNKSSDVDLVSTTVFCFQETSNGKCKTEKVMIVRKCLHLGITEFFNVL